MRSLPTQWRDAAFSIDVDGPSKEGEATLGQSVEVEYEAAHPGYVTYLRLSSHADMTVFRYPADKVGEQGTNSYVIKPPLGSEEVVVLFSSAPLDQLFPSGATSRDLGSDRASAEQFVRQLQQIEAGGVQVASRRFNYMVSAPAGGTEYTTRSIIRRVEDAPRTLGKGPAAATIPSRVEFDFDSDHLTEQGKRDLDVFGEALVSQLHNRSVVLEGHTDSVGTDDYNLSLSQRRAAAARDYLVKSFGLSESQMTTVGKGKSDPVAPNDSAADRSRNRRVDFIFYDASSQPKH